MNSPLPAPAAEAADSQPATDSPMGLAAVPCYLVERIVNGYLLTQGDGRKVYHTDIPELMDIFTRELNTWAKEMNRHEWNGRFVLNFGFSQDNTASHPFYKDEAKCEDNKTEPAWIEWKGGPCPIPDTVERWEYKLGDGMHRPAYGPPKSYADNWEHAEGCGKMYHISAYRVLDWGTTKQPE